MSPQRIDDSPNAKVLPQRLLAADGRFEARFRRHHPVVWGVTLLGPFVLTAGILAVLWVRLGYEFVWRLLGTAAATFFFFGKFVILGGDDGDLVEVQSFLTTEQLFFLVLYMDLITASLLVFHLGFVFKLPWIGPKLSALVEDGQFILQSNPWMKRATFVGLVVFILFPLAATGSVGGSIFGRLLGMSRLATFAGTAIGSVLGCALMYFGNGLINAYLDRDNPLLTIGGIACIAALIFVLNYRYRQLKARHEAMKSAEAKRPEPNATNSSTAT